MVAASQPLAVAAGLEILAKGGNATDAAVATAAALNVTEPMSTGLGGDCFALFYDGATRRVSALNGSGRAPAALTLERLQNEGFGGHLSPFHPYTVTVPGTCAGWCDAVERHGRLSLDAILAPAIRLAEEGFPVAPLTACAWERGVERQLAQAPGGRELTIDGRARVPEKSSATPGWRARCARSPRAARKLSTRVRLRPRSPQPCRRPAAAWPKPTSPRMPAPGNSPSAPPIAGFGCGSARPMGKA